ncbi:hypothetical protein [Priestia megaterium]|uniref:hypothetical protein n=1 Tax=Priestia megaterium TaxID=1404 RepID=UPI003000943A
MSNSRFDKFAVIKEEILINRREQFYKLVSEIIDEEDIESLIFTTLNNISFCEYLLGVEME